jgi:hypothetical protein
LTDSLSKINRNIHKSEHEMVMSSPTKSKSQSRLREKNVVTQQGPFHPVPETCGKKLSAVDAFSAICH